MFLPWVNEGMQLSWLQGWLLQEPMIRAGCRMQRDAQMRERSTDPCPRNVNSSHEVLANLRLAFGPYDTHVFVETMCMITLQLRRSIQATF